MQTCSRFLTGTLSTCHFYSPSFDKVKTVTYHNPTDTCVRPASAVENHLYHSPCCPLSPNCPRTLFQQSHLPSKLHTCLRVKLSVVIGHRHSTSSITSLYLHQTLFRVPCPHQRDEATTVTLKTHCLNPRDNLNLNPLSTLGVAIVQQYTPSPTIWPEATHPS